GILPGWVRSRRKLPRQHALDRIRTLSAMVHEALASHAWPKFGLSNNLKLVQKPCLSKEPVFNNDSPARGTLYQVPPHNESRRHFVAGSAIIGFALADLLETEIRVKRAGSGVFDIDFEKQPADPDRGEPVQVRFQKARGDPVAAPLRRDGDRQV